MSRAAGQFGAVTISTNMAGRGTDIRLGGDRVVALGGLHVIGTNRHESRRVDLQLRGRAGRRGRSGRVSLLREPRWMLAIRHPRLDSGATLSAAVGRANRESCGPA